MRGANTKTVIPVGWAVWMGSIRQTGVPMSSHMSPSMTSRFATIRWVALAARSPGTSLMPKSPSG